MHRFFIAIILTFLSFCLIGQNHATDSFHTELNKVHSADKKATLLLTEAERIAVSDPNQSILYIEEAIALHDKEDSLKIKAAHLKATAYSSLGKYDKAIKENHLSIALSEKVDDGKYLGLSLTKHAIILSQKGDYDSAIHYYYQASVAYEKIADSLSMASNMSKIAGLQQRKGNLKEALEGALKALSILEKLGDKEKQVSVLNIIGVIYDDLGSYTQALEFYQKAHKLAKKFDNKHGLSIIANNIGVVHEIMGHYDIALNYYGEGLSIAREMGNQKNISLFLQNIGVIHSKSGAYEKAFDYYNRAKKIRETLDAKCDLAYTYSSLGFLSLKMDNDDYARLYFSHSLNAAEYCQNQKIISSSHQGMGKIHERKGDFKKALSRYQTAYAVAKNAGINDEVKSSAEEIYNTYKQLGNFKKALEFHEIYKSANDSIFNKTNTQTLNRLGMELEFEREKQKFQLEQNKRESALHERLERRKVEQIATITVVGLLLIIAFILGRSYLLKRQTNENLMTLNVEISEQKEEILQQRNYLEDRGVLVEEQKAELEIKNKELTELNLEKNKLLGIVAHDLRSPLNQMKGFISLIKLESKEIEQSQGHYLDLIEESTERLTSMIRRILDINAIESKKINLKMETGDLGEILHYVCRNMESMALQKNIKIHRQFDHEGYYAKIDKNYLIQVFDNLLSNAIKFSSPESNVYLEIQSNDTYHKVTVKDEGPGISENDQKKLFGEFQRLTAKPTAGEPSTGLGLSIVKKYIEAMNGEISFESSLGKGTSFNLKFEAMNF